MGGQFFHMYADENIRNKASLCSCQGIANVSKRALFFTSVPFYWFLIFKFLGVFDIKLFCFVAGASLMLSMLGYGWGVLNEI